MEREQELKQACDKAYKEAGDNAYFESGFRRGAQWEADSDKWISVDDSLPTGSDIVYLVCVKNKNKENGIPLIDIAVFDSDGIWQKSTVWEDVTHWRELPPAPKTQ